MFISFRNKLGLMFIAVFSLAPLGFWYVMKPLSLRFYDITSTLTSLGQIFGLLGMAMFVITLILSARAKFIENCFGGMDRVYKAHHLLGGISFLLLLFHPLVLAFKFARISFKEAALFLLSGSNNAINFGIIALVILITLLFLTYFSKLRYHIWKLSHKFLGLAFFFAIFHTFFAASDVARNLPLKIYMAGLVVLGISTFLYRTLIGWVLVTKFNYTVVNIKEMSDQTMEIEMASKDKALKFLPGQFAYFNFYSQGIKTESHPFSISSGLNDTNLKIAVKALGDYTASLKNLKRGADVKIEGSFGKFFDSKNPPKNQIWIGGGIGITPFVSMARSLQKNGLKIDLYYTFSSRDKAPFLEELLEITSRLDNFRLFPYGADQEGFITCQAIINKGGSLIEKNLFLCGPPIMISSLKNQFKKVGIPKKNIHLEEFNYL